MMRRMKSEVKSAPDKIKKSSNRYPYPEEEAELYVKTIERLRILQKQRPWPNLITPLRQLCCHPLILENHQNETLFSDPLNTRNSFTLLERILEVGEKALVFASYTK